MSFGPMAMPPTDPRYVDGAPGDSSCRASAA